MARRYVTDFRGDSPNERPFKIKDEPISPTNEDFMGFGDLNSYCNANYHMRKSLSMSDIATIKEELLDLKLSDNKEDTSSRHRRQTSSVLSKTKFVSMAEAIYRYQRDTPDRFHTNKPRSFVGHGPFVRQSVTRPQSPILRCKNRARPLHILSQQEKEELELEEIRKFQIKANPIPKSVIEGSKNLPEVQRKPITIPEPFKLTEVQKKLPPSPEHICYFKARPAPKHILEKPKIDPIKSPVPVTKATSPKFHFKRVKSVDLINNLKKNVNQTKKSEKAKSVPHGSVKPEPFSFEKRDEEMRRKREVRIKHLVEEERKLASQFKAQPLPAGVKKRMQSVTATSAASSNSSENKENYLKFEAKPPLVLYKKPFKPVLQSNQCIMPKAFDLATEKRAVEREQFEMLLKEKEDEIQQIKLQKERELKKAEETIIKELRAKTVHYAKPVPPLAPNLPEKLRIPLTIPNTPKFVRKLKNKELVK